MSAAAGVALRLHAAFTAGDLDGCVGLLAGDVELRTASECRRGVADVRRWAAARAAALPRVAVSAPDVLGSWEDLVVLETPVHSATGAELLGTSRDVVAVRGGVVTALRHLWLAAGDVGPRDRAADDALVQEQAALRRIATHVAEGLANDALLAAVTEAVARMVDAEATSLVRFEPDDTVTSLAAWSARGASPPVGERRALDPALLDVREAGEARSFDAASGSVPLAAQAAEPGLRWSVCVPVVVGDRVWGACVVSSTRGSVPADAEARITPFAALVATALANTEARARVQRLADEQAATRRVAELAASGATLEAVLDRVAEEACHLFGATFTGLSRVDPDGDLTVVALHEAPEVIALGQRQAISEHGLLQEAVRSGRPVRLTRLEDLPADWVACAERLRVTTGLAAPILVDGRVWGGIAVMRSGPSERGSQYRLGRFAELVGTAIGGAHARTALRRVAEEQAALRRVAEVAAAGASQAQLLDAVVEETRGLFGLDLTALVVYEQDDSSVVVAERGAPPGMGVGQMGSGDGDGVAPRVRRTRRPVFVGDYGGLAGHGPQLAQRNGFTCGAGAPIIIEGRVWGALLAVGSSAGMPQGIEDDLATFTELTGTALANVHARAELERLAGEQAALRQVAELVARGVGEQELLAKVAVEASRLIEGEAASLVRRGGEDGAVVVASAGGEVPPGQRTEPTGDERAALVEVLRTGRSARHDGFGWLGLEDDQRSGTRGSYVAAPIVVEDRIWGTLVVSRRGRALPVGAEGRLGQFGELVAAAVANAENGARLAASRARVFAAADEARRRIQRDLHDGAQQRLVQTILTLRLAVSELAGADQPPLAALVRESLDHAERARDDLRDLVRGILPAALTRRGLRASVEELARSLPIPVAVQVETVSLPQETETTAYFVISEALTNVVKHAAAASAAVHVWLDDDVLRVAVRDDGSGGADVQLGSGLTGLSDRVEAHDGRLVVTSPPGAGTLVRAEMPVRRGRWAASTSFGKAP